MAINLATAYVQVVPSMRGVGSAIVTAFTGASNKAGKAGGAAASRGMSAGLAKMGAVFGVVSKVAGTAMTAIGNSIGGAVNRADAMSNFPKIMSNFGYSAKDSAKAVKLMSDSIDGLPTSLPALTGMVQQLAPMTKGIGDATRISLAFNDALLAGGQSTQVQENALVQYSQMLAAGKPDMQAWRSIQSAMPGQLNQVAKAMLGPTKNSQDLYDALKDGTVSFDDLNNAMMRLDTQGENGFASFSKQARAATQGISTAVENVRNRVAKGIQEVIEAIGTERIAGAINKISSTFVPIGKMVAAVVTQIKKYLQGLWDMLENDGAVNAFKAAFATIKTAVSQSLGSIDWGGLAPPESVSDAILAVGQWSQRMAQMAVPAIGSVAGAFQKIIDATGKAITAVSDVAQNLLGLSPGPVAGLFQQAFQGVAGIIGGVADALGHISDWVAANSSTVTVAITGIGSALAGIRVSQGITAVLPMLSDLGAAFQLVGPGISEFGTAIDALGGKAGGLTRLIGGIGSAFSGLNGKFGSIGTALSGFATNVAKAGGGVKGLWSILGKGGKIGVIVSVITAVAGALYAFFTKTKTGQKAWAQFTSFLTSAGTKVQSAFQSVWQAIQPVFDQLGTAIGQFLTMLGQMLGPSLQQLGEAFGNLGSALGGTFVQILQMLGQAFTQIGQALAPVIPLLIQLGQAIMGAIMSAIQALMPVIQAIMGVIAAVLPVIMAIVTQVISLLMPVISAIINAVTQLMPIITAVVQGILSVVTPVVQTISSVLQGVIQVLQGIIGFVVGVFTGNWGQAWNGIKQAFSGVWNAISGLVTGVWNTIKAAFASGLNIIKTIWTGAWNAIGSFFGSIWSGLKNAATAGIHAVVGAVSGIRGKITGFFSGAGGWLINAGKAILDGLLNGLKSAWNGITGFIGGIGDWIKQHKGPISYDCVLLIPAGHAIMDGFAKGLGAGFDRQVAPLVGSVAGQVARGMAVSVPAPRFQGADPGSLMPDRARMEAAYTLPAGNDRDDRVAMEIRSLHEDLGDIISDRTPVMGQREFSRKVRAQISLARR